MKSIFLLVFILCSAAANAQDTRDKVMDQRVREFLRVLKLSDKKAWEKYVKENYTRALIDKPLRGKVETTEGGSTSVESVTPETATANKIEAKAAMFSRLHDDFGDASLISLEKAGEGLEMKLKGIGLTGILKFRFENKSPYLIDGIGVEAMNR